MEFSVNTFRPTFHKNDQDQTVVSLYFTDVLYEESQPVIDFGVHSAAAVEGETTLTINMPLNELLQFEVDARSCWGDEKLYTPEDKPFFDNIKRELLALVAQIDGFRYDADDAPPSAEEKPVDPLTLVHSLEMTVRTENALLTHGIMTLNQLVLCTDNDLMRMPRMGRRTINEIKEALEKRSLTLKPDDRELFHPLEITKRAEKVLVNYGITTVAQIIEHSDHELMRVRDLGRKSLNEITQELAKHGLSLKPNSAV